MVKVNPGSSFENIWAWRPSWSCDQNQLNKLSSGTKIVSEKNYCFTFSSYKIKMDQIWHGRKIGQGQPRVIIWTYLVELEYPNAAYQLSKTLAFWFQRRRFFKVFTIYGHGGYIGHVTWTIWTTLHFLTPWRLHIKFWLQSAQRFLRKRSLKMLNMSDLGQRSLNDLDLWYSYMFMFSFS